MIYIQLCLHRMHAVGRMGKLCVGYRRGGKDGSVEKSNNQSWDKKTQDVLRRQLINQFDY